MWRTIALLVACGASVAGCTWSGGAAVSSAGGNDGAAVALTSYETSGDNGYRIVVRYPKTWRRYHWQVVTSFTNSLVYLSTGREHPPCKTTHRKGMTEIACRPPIDRLAPGGVLVTWTGVGFPAPGGRPPLDGVAGKLVRLPSGWVEKTSINTPAVCSGLHATRSIFASFARTSPGWAGRSFHMSACLRGPDVAAHTEQVLSMLRDVRFVRA